MKKALLSFLLITTLLVQIPARAGLALSIGPIGATFLGAKVAATVTVTSPTIMTFVTPAVPALVASYFVYRASTDTSLPIEKRQAGMGYGIAAILMALVWLDETSEAAHVANLSPELAYGVFALTEAEMISYNNNTTVLSSLLNQVALEQTHSGLAEDEAHSQLLKLAESELPPNAFVAYSKIIQVMQKALSATHQ